MSLFGGAAGELVVAGVRALLALIQKAVEGDLTAQERLHDILGDEARSTTQRKIEEAAAEAKFGGD
jgi:hypothetical protein